MAFCDKRWCSSNLFVLCVSLKNWLANRITYNSKLNLRLTFFLCIFFFWPSLRWFECFAAKSLTSNFQCLFWLENVSKRIWTVYQCARYALCNLKPKTESQIKKHKKKECHKRQIPSRKTRNTKRQILGQHLTMKNASSQIWKSS